MAIDFKNIVFKFVKITGGTARIDADMTEKIFNSTKPSGVYRCFIFPKRYFSGYDYDDVQNLVSIEEAEIWDKVNRDTFLGFNEETNEFIVNYNAWLSAKDSDLKTVGELPHSGQAGWFITTLSASKSSNSKFELLQSDGSKLYLSIKPYAVNKIDSYKQVIESSVCVENKLKSILNSKLFEKNDALFAKCADDNSVLMADDCVKLVRQPSRSGGTAISNLRRDNKEYGADVSGSNRFNTTYKYCKKILSFESSTSKNVINTAFRNIFAQNTSTTLDTECTHTNNFEDILASGESLTLYTIPKARSFRFCYNKTSNSPFFDGILYDNIKMFFNYNNISGNHTLSLYSDKSVEGISCDLISCDPRKPFVYDSPTRNIVINGFNNARQLLKVSDFITDIPDGFIFLVKIRNSILRYKKGEPAKVRSSTTRDEDFLKISGTTQFGSSLFFNGSDPLDYVEISKNEAISGSGFTEVSGSTIELASIYYSTFLVTVLRV